MKRVLSPLLPKPGHPVQLSEKEADHLTRVLRLRDGDLIEALDGKGHSALVILRIKGGGPRIEFMESDTPASQMDQSVPPITLEMAILKGDAMEWVIEKSVELGVHTLIPLMTAHTVVQIKNKGPEAFQERWQKIADQSLKQCGRLERMEVALPTPLETLLSQTPATVEAPRLWLDELGRNENASLSSWLAQTPQGPLTSARLLIGPEGGWSDAERDLLKATSQTSSTHRLGLGPWVLRAETAAISATSLLAAYFRAKSLTKMGA